MLRFYDVLPSERFSRRIITERKNGFIKIWLISIHFALSSQRRHYTDLSLTFSGESSCPFDATVLHFKRLDFRRFV